MKKKKIAESPLKEQSALNAGELETIMIKVRPDLYSAYQRCSWIIIHETGREQLDVMQEMVEDFLIKHGC